MKQSFHLSHFREWIPPYFYPQEALLDWLAAAHARAESRSGGLAGKSEAMFREQLAHAFRRYGATGDQVSARGSVLSDFGNTDWRLHRLFSGHIPPMEERLEVYTEAANPAFDSFFPADTAPSDDIVHVTCTGYLSPSAAQRLVERRGWQSSTRVTHAYHMGCFAAFPGIRIAAGLAATGREGAVATVAHTEFCTLHFHPLKHSPEQIVVQSLFADGAVAYDVTAHRPEGPSYEILSSLEETIPGTLPLMTWAPADGGMSMTLAREVPTAISGSIMGWFGRLAEKAGLTLADLKDNARFAVHPGGPRILKVVSDALSIADDRMDLIRKVFMARGNMSSATVPTAWMGMLSNPDVKDGELVAAVAFGPGLTASGALLRVRK